MACFVVAWLVSVSCIIWGLAMPDNLRYLLPKWHCTESQVVRFLLRCRHCQEPSTSKQFCCSSVPGIVVKLSMLGHPAGGSATPGGRAAAAVAAAASVVQSWAPGVKASSELRAFVARIGLFQN